MVAIKNPEHNKCWQARGETRALAHGRREHEMKQLLWKMVWQFLNKITKELPFDPAAPLLGLYPKELKTGS